MSGGELLLTLIVALLVFGPNKLPLLARHLGRIAQKFNQYRQKAEDIFHEQIAIEQLKENIKKAEKAEEEYKNKAS